MGSAVQWARWKGGGLTSRDRLNRSENYVLLGFLLVIPSQSVVLLVSHSVTQDNFPRLVSTPVPEKLNNANFSDLRNQFRPIFFSLNFLYSQDNFMFI